MGDIRDNISRIEMTCRCGLCSFAASDTELMDVLQDATDHFKKEYPAWQIILDIRSGNRCYLHNEKVQVEYHESVDKTYIPGSSRSTHVDGLAADIKLWRKRRGVRIQIEAEIVYQYFNNKYKGKYGVGGYYNRTHVDVKPGRSRRWRG